VDLPSVRGLVRPVWTVREDDARAPHAWTCHLRAPRLPESDSARPPMAQHPPPQRAKFRRVERPVTAASSDRGPPL